ncbi:MAG: holo-ACP synthase [Candidatus Thermoplasmatota archaeon]|nr:holo-ACP synthase [Candidatus Thermoplasmatota archaeon]
MIKGIGIDLVDVESFGKIRDLSRIFTEGEISYCSSKNDDILHFAARFALKEAVYKSLGISEERSPDWREIGTVKTEGDRIEVTLSGDVARIASEMKIQRIEASISHIKDMAVAVAVSIC